MGIIYPNIKYNIDKICCKNIDGFTIGKVYSVVYNLQARKVERDKNYFFITINDEGKLSSVQSSNFCDIQEWRDINITRIIND